MNEVSNVCQSATVCTEYAIESMPQVQSMMWLFTHAYLWRAEESRLQGDLTECLLLFALQPYIQMVSSSGGCEHMPDEPVTRPYAHMDLFS